MDKLTKINEENLAKVLDEWFCQHIPSFILNKHFWARNPVGIVMRKHLKAVKKWKDRGRYKHPKGWQIGQSKLEKDQNW